MNTESIKVGVSSCLLGHKVRYDGGHKNHPFINKVLSEYFELINFCPEMDIGLGTPRETIHLVSIDGETRCVGTKTPTLDVTEQLKDSANHQSHWHQALCGYILKSKSPSCGMERVKLYNEKGMPSPIASGIYAETMMKNFPNMPVEEEGRLNDPVLKENFIQRVYFYYRWRKLVGDFSATKDYQLSKLQTFHARHKYIYMSHDQNLLKTLGQQLAGIQKLSQADCDAYLTTAMKLLKHRATRKNHVNTLQHIQGYLKKPLDKDDKAELADTIEHYRLGLLPLIVPITLLKHHFRKNPDPYINQSYYLSPHPGELMLLNHL